MALSLLQEAQTARGLAAVRSLAGMKLEEDRNMSTPMNTDTSPSVYAGMHASTMHAQLLAAASHQTAALMALPMSLRASLGLFPHHPALFGGWPPASSSQSPPASPISPISHSARSAKTKLTNNNHIVSTTTNDIMPKKVVKRKASAMKQTDIHEVSHPVEIPGANINNNLMSTGPISPPTSGSSPQSINSLDQAPVMPNNVKDPSRDKVFTCKICNRGFGYKHVLQNHERTHTGEKPFECPECHKRFTRDHHLKTHMRLHTGEKPYHCKFCERKFVQVANLRRHLRVHTGDRPYTCELCQSKFSDSNQLKAHMLIHNGQKPFECDRCHSRFRRRHHMLHHKCGIISPPTPAISPAMSLSDMKSASSRSEASDESMDLGKPSLHQFATLALPTYLPETEAILEAEKRNRKSHDIRRIIRMPTPQILHVPTALPEQTEPEDLSMHSPRSPLSNVSHDEDLDDLDDAASLYIKSRHSHYPRKSLDA